jgi:DNA polymerase-4
VGPATERALAGLGATTVAQLRALPLETLTVRFGRHGAGLYHYARGEDDRAVETHRERKSLGQERTYARDLTAVERMEVEIAHLAEKVAEGLARRALAARTVTLKVRYGDFTTLTRSHSLPWPLQDGPTIAEHAWALLRATEAGRRPVRLLGVSTSNLVRGGERQLGLFD